jgi:hypothetical protein
LHGGSLAFAGVASLAVGNFQHGSIEENSMMNNGYGPSYGCIYIYVHIFYIPELSKYPQTSANVCVKKLWGKAPFV